MELGSNICNLIKGKQSTKKGIEGGRERFWQRAEGSWGPAQVVVGITEKEALCVRNTLLARTGLWWSVPAQDGVPRHPRQRVVWQSRGGGRDRRGCSCRGAPAGHGAVRGAKHLRCGSHRPAGHRWERTCRGPKRFPYKHSASFWWSFDLHQLNIHS